ncbi:nucleotidyltransferase domain-containing protein [Desulfoplanes sp. PS50]|jgi:predicted nucleotidyltransferase
MKDIELLKRQIIERLQGLNPEKVILFGSYADGTANDESDLDLYVVTKDDFIPKNFQEKTQVRLKVSRVLSDLQKTIPIDIITHTQKMHTKFINLNSSFAREITEKGIRLI